MTEVTAVTPVTAVLAVTMTILHVARTLEFDCYNCAKYVYCDTVTAVATFADVTSVIALTYVTAMITLALL